MNLAVEFSKYENLSSRKFFIFYFDVPTYFNTHNTSISLNIYSHELVTYSSASAHSNHWYYIVVDWFKEEKKNSWQQRFAMQCMQCIFFCGDGWQEGRKQRDWFDVYLVDTRGFKQRMCLFGLLLDGLSNSSHRMCLPGVLFTTELRLPAAGGCLKTRSRKTLTRNTWTSNTRTNVHTCMKICTTWTCEHVLQRFAVHDNICVWTCMNK
mgnify:CR=1 FL=1